MPNKSIQSLKYIFLRHLFRREFLIASENIFGTRFKFKTEDVIGRHIYKYGEYENEISQYILNHVDINDGICLDNGANIGWYSLLLQKASQGSSEIYAFEPDPLNFRLLKNNIEINGADNIHPVNCALSNKKEEKKLYRYSNKNLGRHSLLEINESDSVDVEALVLDDFIAESNIDCSKIKFIKIDIEGYEYFALSGALKTLESVQCIVSEFVPEHMKKGGVDPALLIDILMGKGFKPNELENGTVKPLSRDELLNSAGLDIIWLKAP
ncbi:hypothetical protein AB833_29430 [Chromatiales bacterium (ex Bugula neritina AB1)]|nr:hypothetical protein AB833_29430 [Chromatiales bacterium (ex Bugula neritina AB1)]